MSSITYKNNYSHLWREFVNGNKDAFSEIYRLSYKSLYAYGLSFKVSGEQVRDIIQDLFLKLYAQPGYIKDTDTIRPFMFTSIRNACLNVLKGEDRYSDLDDIDEFEIEYLVDENLFEKKDETDNLNLYVKTILDSLTARQKEIIYLRFLHQMEYEEISGIMNLSEQAARNLTHRAITRLRKENDGYSLFVLIMILLSYS